jgi:predicted methyltransferase
MKQDGGPVAAVAIRHAVCRVRASRSKTLSGSHKAMNHHIVTAIGIAGVLLASSGAGWTASNIPAYVTAAIADSHRPKADTDRDADRKPESMLGFSGVKPGDKVGELIPATGYATRLLSKAVGPAGHVYAINLDTLNDRIKDQIKPVTDDPAYANVSVSNQVLGALKLPEPVDVVWTSQNYHDFKNPGMFSADTVAMDKAIFAALKPGGLYVIIDHAAAAGSGTRDTGTMHRIDPATVKAEVLAAGFVLDGESKDLANPNDPHTERVPGPGGVGDKSDKFFYKFRKPR